MADSFNISIGDLLAVAEKPLNPVYNSLGGPIFEFSISPEFFAAFVAEKDRRAGSGVLIPAHGLAAGTLGGYGNGRHDSSS